MSQILLPIDLDRHFLYFISNYYALKRSVSLFLNNSNDDGDYEDELIPFTHLATVKLSLYWNDTN